MRFLQNWLVEPPLPYPRGLPIDADLPPRPRLASPDLQTAIIPGRFGLPQGGGVVSELPPRGRGRSIDLLTSYVPGRQIAVTPFPQGGVSADLPPRGRGPSIDLRTAIIPGGQGPGAQIQNDSIARWFPISMPPDFRTWLIPGTAVTSVGFKDLAGDLSVTPAFAADLNVTIALAGDLPVTPAFAADVADIFNLVGDLAPSIVFAADTADIFQFVGDLPVTPAFAGDLGLTLHSHRRLTGYPGLRGRHNSRRKWGPIDRRSASHADLRRQYSRYIQSGRRSAGHSGFLGD